MSSTGASAGMAPNGMAPHLSHRPQTPAYTVGNQFVQQFYSILHSQPQNLYRFYTDHSTVTHSDAGTDTEQPSCVTVTSQKEIRVRMAEMGFDQATTEIWSVDSQYSMSHGVLVMVTGTLECKGKKKRDFVQTFFLAPQEKGYYVLNDVFRYCQERYPQSAPQPKENYNNQHNPALQNALYSHQQQVQPVPGQLYYPGVPQPAAHHAVYSQQAYQTSTQPSANNKDPNHQAQQVMHPPAPAPQSQYATHVKQAPAQDAPKTTAPAAEAQASAPAQEQEQKPVQQPPKPIPQPAPEPPKPIASPAKPKEISAPPPAVKQAEELPKPPAQAAPEPPKPVEKKESKTVATQSTQTPAAEVPKPAAEPSKPAEQAPSGPLTYADRLKMSANANASSTQTQKSAPSRPAPAAPATRAVPINQQRPTTSPPTASPVVKPPETSADEAVNADSTQLGNGSKNNSSAKEEDVVTTSIFVGRLPDDITASKLEEVFSQYGKIKGGIQGVSLKQQRNTQKGDFAFVEFEDQASMQAAVEAKTVIDGKTVQVSERKPLLPKDIRGYGGGRGGRGEGRGDGRGFRGRGEGRGRGGRDGRPHTTGGRAEGRPEGGRGRGYEGRGGEGGRGRGDRGRGRPFNPHSGGRQGPAQSAPTPQPAAA